MVDNLCSYVCFDNVSNQWVDVYVYYEHTGSYHHVINILTYNNRKLQYHLPVVLFVGDTPRYVLYKRTDTEGKLQRMQWLAILESFSTHFSINETNEVIHQDDLDRLEARTPPALGLNFPANLPTGGKTVVVSQIPDSRSVFTDSDSDIDVTPQPEGKDSDYRPIVSHYEESHYEPLCSTKASSTSVIASPNSILKGSRSNTPRRAATQLRVHFSTNVDSRNSDMTHTRVTKTRPESSITLSQWSMACESTLGKWSILIVFLGLVGLLFVSYATPLFYMSSAMTVTGATMLGISFFSAASQASNAEPMPSLENRVYR